MITLNFPSRCVFRFETPHPEVSPEKEDTRLAEGAGKKSKEEFKKMRLQILREEFSDKQPKTVEDAKKEVIGKFAQFEVKQAVEDDLKDARTKGLMDSTTQAADVLTILKGGKIVGFVSVDSKLLEEYPYAVYRSRDWQFLRLSPWPKTPYQIWHAITEDIMWDKSDIEIKGEKT